MKLKRFVGLALLVAMLLPLTVHIPEVEAAYIYVDDYIHSEIGWMDVKRIGWEFTLTELLLKVQYQTNILNSRYNYFWGYFYLDTDRNPTTGDYYGSDYYVYFGYFGDGWTTSPPFLQLFRFDEGLGYFVFVKYLSAPSGMPGGDTVELRIPLSDIGSSTAMDIYFGGGGYTYDYIETSYLYNTASEDRVITVDGNPTDWAGDLPDVTDPAGDSAPGLFDATTFHTTDGGGKLYMKLGLAAAPPNLHPEDAEETNSALSYRGFIYFDTDLDPGTGENIGGIGADYRLTPVFYIFHTMRGPDTHLWKWIGGSWVNQPLATLETALGSCLELSLLLSNIGVSGSTIKIYISNFYMGNIDRVPNFGSFTAAKGAPSLSNGCVYPSSGDTLTTFSYYVTYSDPEGAAPAVKLVWIDGVLHSMSLYSGSASSGTYRYQTTLPSGSHNYYFEFSDGVYTVRIPSLGSYSGPTVPPETATLLVGLLNFDDYRNRMGSVTPMEPSTTFYFPHFHQDANWQTYIAIANPNDQEAPVTLIFYSSDGSTLKEETLNVPSKGKQGFLLSSLGITGSGWIRVESYLPIVGLLNFDDYANRMGSMSGVTPAPHIYFPHFQQDASWQTYYAIVNPSDIAASITITYYRGDGLVLSTEDLTLNPRSKTGRFAISGTGWIAVQSDVPIVGMLNFDDYANRMGSIEHAIPSQTLYFPHFHQDSDWQTYYAIVNPSASDATVTVTYYGADGTIIQSTAIGLNAHSKYGTFAVGGTGWIKVESSLPLVGMLNFDDYSNRMGSIVAVTPESSIMFPHFHQDADWQTFYAIVNLGPSATFTSTYYREDGSTITSTSTTIAANGKIGQFATSGTGWLRIH